MDKSKPGFCSNMKRLAGIFRLAALLTVALAALFLPTPSALAMEQTYRVLFISSYHPNFQSFAPQVRGLRDGLKEAACGHLRCQLDIEFMDTKRFPDAANVISFRDRLEEKLAKLPNYDLFVFGDDNALRFALAERDGLFAGRPIVFHGINDLDKAASFNGDPSITGVVEAASVLETLDVIKELSDPAGNIIIIVDETTSAQAVVEPYWSDDAVREEYRLKMWSMSDHSYMEIRDKLITLPRENAVLFVSASRDRIGDTIRLEDFMDLITEKSNVPLYTLWRDNLGLGALGGKLVDPYQQGRLSGLMVADIIAGRPVSEIPVLGTSPNVYAFDWNIIQRYSIDADLLPEGSVIINQPKGLWEEQKNLIITASSVMISLTVLTFVLLFNTARLKRLQRSLHSSEARFRRLFENAEISIWNEDFSQVYEALNRLSRDGVSDLRQYLEENKQAAWDLAAMVKVNQVNKATLTLFKAGTEEEFIRSIDQVFGPDAIDVFIGELCAFWEKKEVFRSETLHKTLDGEELTVIISMPIPKTEEGLKSVPVSLLDITERKRAEIALRESEEKYRLMTETSGVIPWEVDTATFQFTYIAPQVEALLGYPAQDWYQHNFWPAHIHRDDREEALASCKKYTERGMGNDFEYRMIASDGRAIWLRDIVKYIRKENCSDVLRGVLIDITDLKQAEEKLIKQSYDLGERVKEQTGLYSLSEILSRLQITAEEALEAAVEVLPPAWQYPEIACARITVSGYSATTKNFNETIWRQAADITRQGEKIGAVEIFYLAETPQLDEGPFLLEERRLIDSMATSIETFLDRKHAERAKLEAKEDAELANRAKSQFLASMSHELRTPLNAVLGFAQMLQFDPKNPLSSTQNKNVESILAGGNHLLQLVNEILDLAKIEADQLDLFLEDVDANEVIADCVTLITPIGKPRRIRIDDQFSSGSAIHLHTDRIRLKQVLINLLSNAVKYNKDGGTVALVGCEVDNRFLRLSVTDTGVGIPKKDHSSVFQMFHRGEKDPMKAREGAGIGLAVTKLLVGHMGGQIGFESEEGIGSTFWIELPLASNQEVLIWTDDLRVGVDAIDGDHQAIIVLVNKISRRSVGDEDVDAAIGEMIDYTRYHFRREEALMEVCGYPDLEVHRGKHLDLIAQVNKMNHTWRAERSPETCAQLRMYLRDWWIGHIVNVDTEIAKYAKGKAQEIDRALERIR